MIKRFSIAVLLALLLFSAHALMAQGKVIKAVQVRGNQRISEEAIRFHLRLSEGQAFSEKAIQRNYRALYDLGVFDNVIIDYEEQEDGIIVTVDVKERPFIGSIEYSGVNPPLVSRIEERLRRERISMRVNGPYDPLQVERARREIEKLLAQDGHPFAHVSIERRELNPMTVNLTFFIDKGPRVEVVSINFVGNRAFSDQTLKRQMRWVKEDGLISSITGRDTYSRARIEEDLRRIALFYQQHGYARVQVGEPRVDIIRRKGMDMFPVPLRHKIETSYVITIPIVEGDVYRIDGVRLEGKTLHYDAEIDPILNRFRKGELYDAAKLQRAFADIKRVFGSHGYIALDSDIFQSFDEANKTVNVSFKLDKLYPFYVRRIEFVGNNRTPDKMLRRELLLREGDPFNEAKLERSLIKLNRTGLIEPLSRQDVSLKLDLEQREVDLVVSVKDRGKQGFWFTGGAAGIGGGYAGIVYTALNFLGLGEILRFESTGGPRNSNFVLDFLANNFLDTKFSLGFSVFRRFFNFGVFSYSLDPARALGRITNRSVGGALTGSYALSERSRFGLSFQGESIRTQDISTQALGRLVRREMRPMWVYDSTDGLWRPRGGQVLATSAGFAGGLFGGNVNVVRPQLEYKLFAPDPLTSGRNTLAFRTVFAHARGFGGRDVPLYERFYADGYLVRGFKAGQMSPLALRQLGEAFQINSIGGDTLTTFSAEYRVPIREPLSMTYFFDAGLSAALRDPHGDLKIIESTNSLWRASLGTELRLQLPLINQPVRLIFAYNPLRLSQTFLGPKGKALTFSEPRGRIRLALGESF